MVASAALGFEYGDMPFRQVSQRGMEGVDRERVADQHPIDLGRRRFRQQELNALGIAPHRMRQLIRQGAEIVQCRRAPRRHQAEMRGGIHCAAKLAGVDFKNNNALTLKGFCDSAGARLGIGCQSLRIRAILPPGGPWNPFVCRCREHDAMSHVKHVPAISEFANQSLI